MRLFDSPEPVPVISKSIPCKQNSQRANSLCYSAFLSIQIYNTVHADKQNLLVYPPPPLQTKSVEGLEFGQKHKYFFPLENDELKPK